MRVGVVISSFNGLHLLERYLPFLFGALHGFEYEVVVVDDGSRDRTSEFIEAEYPSIKLIELKKNRGFAIANNTGAKMSTGDVILFLNNDVRVTEDFLAPVCGHFENPDVFAVSPRVLLPRYGNDVNEGFSTARFCRGMFELEFPEMNKERLYSRPVFSLYATGGAMAVNRRKFLSLGGFDDMFSPFYCEDMDLCYRAWKRGWKIIYEPNSVVYHYHQSTTGRLLSQRKIDAVIGKNRLLFMWKDLTDDRLFLSHWLWLPRNIIGGLRMGSYSLLRNFLNAFPKLLEALRARELEKKYVIRGDKEVLGLFSSNETPNVTTQYNTKIITGCDRNKVLIIMPQSLGDVYRMTGIVDGFKKKYPDKRIDFMTKKRCFGILEGNPHIERTILYPEDDKDPYGVVEFDELPGREKMMKEYGEIYTPYYGFQLNFGELMKNKDTGKNIVELFAESCGLKGAEIGRPRIKEEEFSINEGYYIVVHPQTHDDSRNWDYFPHLVKMLVRDGITVYQVGTGDDELIRGCMDCRGLPLGKLAYFLRNAAVFIGVDSFPAHLSGGVGTRSIILYGGTDANFSMPYWGNIITLEPDRRRFGCKEACHTKNCSKRRKCINGIRPGEVYEKVLWVEGRGKENT